MTYHRVPDTSVFGTACMVPKSISFANQPALVPNGIAMYPGNSAANKTLVAAIPVAIFPDAPEVRVTLSLRSLLFHE